MPVFLGFHLFCELQPGLMFSCIWSFHLQQCLIHFHFVHPTLWHFSRVFFTSRWIPRMSMRTGFHRLALTQEAKSRLIHWSQESLKVLRFYWNRAVRITGIYDPDWMILVYLRGQLRVVSKSLLSRFHELYRPSQSLTCDVLAALWTIKSLLSQLCLVELHCLNESPVLSRHLDFSESSLDGSEILECLETTFDRVIAGDYQAESSRPHRTILPFVSPVNM